MELMAETRCYKGVGSLSFGSRCRAQQGAVSQRLGTGAQRAQQSIIVEGAVSRRVCSGQSHGIQPRYSLKWAHINHPFDK